MYIIWKIVIEIMSFPFEMVIFLIVMLIYQRVVRGNLLLKQLKT